MDKTCFGSGGPEFVLGPAPAAGPISTLTHFDGEHDESATPQYHVRPGRRAPGVSAKALRLYEEAQGEGIFRINAAFAHADRLEAEATLALIDRLEVAILARTFRGELVLQDPADEPASVLLDRIRAQRAAAPKQGGGVGWRQADASTGYLHHRRD